MCNIQIFIIALLIGMIIYCIFWKGKEQYYYSQGYYPYYYSGGYIPDYPSHKMFGRDNADILKQTDPRYYTQAYDPYSDEDLGYKGVGSYLYPGYGSAYAKQKEEQCNIGCTSDYEYTRGNKDANAIRAICKNSCKTANPYSV